MRYALFLAELKRRKVFRVAAVYGATAFVILQAADIIFPSLGLPRWTVTLVVALSVIGFPMALALAWTFEASADGVRRTVPANHAELVAIMAQPRASRWPAGIAALIAVLLFAGATAWTLGYRGGGGRSGGYDSIAVLPFANLSGSADNEYFGDGLAEELLNALAGIQGLKVAARTSSFAFKGANKDVRVIGDTLGVATVLEGSVRRSADRIRITAQLIDARSGYHLWSQTYDRPLTDLFAVQDAIAREIASALAGRFAKPKHEELYHGGTKDVQAYDLYLLGRQKWVTRKIPLLREAIGHFEQAIARDSSFALAWSGLADAIDALAWRAPDGRALVPQGKYAAQRALMLDPDLAEAWASVAVLALDMDRDFRVGELGLRRAIQLKPSYAPPYMWLADALRYSGRVEEALEPGLRGLDLDPVSGLGMNGLLQTYMILGRDQEAREIARRVQKIGYTDLGTLVNFVSAGARLGFTPQEMEQFAVEWARIRGYSKPEEAGIIGLAARDPSLRPRAVEVLRRMTDEGINPAQVAELCLAVGATELAVTNVMNAVEKNDPTIIVIGTDRVFDALRKDPRFIQALQQLRLPNGVRATE